MCTEILQSVNLQVVAIGFFWKLELVWRDGEYRIEQKDKYYPTTLLSSKSKKRALAVFWEIVSERCACGLEMDTSGLLAYL